MLAAFKRIRPDGRAWRKVGMAGFIVGVAALAFFWGRHGAPRAAAQQPGGPHPPGNSASDYDRRVVAFIYGNVPVTREELGEYLIARFGTERVEFLVNRRIIDMACQARKITVSDAEVDAQLKADIDLFGQNITLQQFVDGVLKRYNKTLYEWREDVIRPKLALSKFCKDQIVVSEEDIQKAFESHFGEMIECRMIVLPEQMGREAAKIYQRVSQSDEEFDKEARKQFIPQLAARGGEIPPIYKHFSDKNIEKAAFELKNPGDVTPLMTMEDKTNVILKLVRRKPPETTRKLANEREALYKEVAETKLAQAIPKVFKVLREEARPNILLKREVTRQDTDRQAHGQFPVSPGMAPPAAGSLRGQ